MERKNKIFLILLAIFFGISIAASIEPYSSNIFSILGAFSIYIAIRFLKNQNYKTNLFYGFLFSISSGIFAFHWLASTLMHYAHLSWWIAVPLFIFANLIFTIKIPLLFIAVKWSSSKSSLTLVWQLIFWAIIGDLLSYQIFPWYWGNLLSGNNIIEQSASLIGVYGLGVFYFLQGYLFWLTANYLFRFLGSKKIVAHKIKQIYFNLSDILQAEKQNKLSIIFSILLVLFSYGYGLYRLQLHSGEKTQDTIQVAIVQTNTALSYKNKIENKNFAAKSLNTFFNMGLKAIYQSKGKLDLLIFPESAVPFHGITNDELNKKRAVYSSSFHAAIAFLSRFSGATILFNDLQAAKTGDYNNMEIFPLDANREISEKIIYHKQKLLPFGEYLPMEKTFPFIRETFPEASNYIPGRKSNSLELSYTKNKKKKLPKLTQKDLNILSNPSLVLKNWPEYSKLKKYKIAPLICYEALSPQLLRSFFNYNIKRNENKTKLKHANKALMQNTNPAFIVNLSNDAWFGNSLASYQHSSAARLRSIESNRYLLRATLSGISSVIDNKGRYLKKLEPPSKAGILITKIPLMQASNTFFLKYGNLLIYIFLILILFIAIIKPQKILAK